jgi:GNAT superfamily N-acetyltransferase
VGVTHVEILVEADRTNLCGMLAESSDFPYHLLDLYRRGRNRDVTFVAWREGKIDGVLTGSFDLDLTGIEDFDSFDLPPGPHAFLDRVHVRDSSRGLGVGSVLTDRFAREAAERDCSFIGGSIDRSSDPTTRRVFFERLGFSINESDRFGAHPSDVLAAIADRRSQS